LTNHALIRLSGRRRGYVGFSDYFVIGDDVVIFNNEVAKEYTNILGEIGVPYKKEDSILPRPSHPLEIAKRLFRKGVEVSPLPLRLAEKDPHLFQLVL
jgi:hypothetical protein